VGTVDQASSNALIWQDEAVYTEAEEQFKSNYLTSRIQQNCEAIFVPRTKNVRFSSLATRRRNWIPKVVAQQNQSTKM
jgi:hypothetical protein